jgi:hypothetical protein
MPKAQIRTQVFIDGRVLEVRCANYQEILDNDQSSAKDRVSAILTLMQRQHKELLREVVRGHYDQALSPQTSPSEPLHRSDVPRAVFDEAEHLEPAPHNPELIVRHFLGPAADELPTLRPMPAPELTEPRVRWNPSQDNAPRASDPESTSSPWGARDESDSDWHPSVSSEDALLARLPLQPELGTKGSDAELFALFDDELERQSQFTSSEQVTDSLPILALSDHDPRGGRTQVASYRNLDAAAGRSSPSPSTKVDEPKTEPRVAAADQPPASSSEAPAGESSLSRDRNPAFDTLVDFALPASLRESLLKHVHGLKKPTPDEPPANGPDLSASRGPPQRRPSRTRPDAPARRDSSRPNLVVVERSLDEVLKGYLSDKEDQ